MVEGQVGAISGYRIGPARKNHRQTLLTGATISVLVASVAGAAIAQDNPTQSAIGPAGAAVKRPSTPSAPSISNAPALADVSSAPSAHVEEIVVTAQRRRENLQNVPVTVTALTAAALDRANITDTSSLQQVTPGLTWSTANRSSLPYIRGIGSSDSSVGNESSVALYIDGVYIENTTATTLEFNNIDRIEVLKGPQGTLFGRNATGGLIQIITKEPSQQTTGNFEIGYGNYSTLHANGYLSGPLTSNLSGDVAVVYNSQNQGWGHNVVTGRDVDLDHTLGISGKALLDLGATRITLAADYTNQFTDISGERNIVPGETTFGGEKSLPGFYDTQSNIDPMGELLTGGASLHIEHNFDFAKLTSISSFRGTRFTSGYDLDETSLPILQVKFLSKVAAFTQELQLASTGSGPLKWIVGVFYMHRDGYNPAETLSGLAFSAAPFYGAYTLHTAVLTDTAAPYAQATYNLTSKTDITGGVRYSYEHQTFSGYEVNKLGHIVAAVPSDTDATFTQPTFRAAIDHHFTDTVMAYASFNTGFKGGLYNANSVIPTPAKPETVEAYEVGLKTDLLDRRLRLNASIFDYSYKNIQLIEAADPTKGTPTNIVNAAQASLAGLDASMDVVPIQGLTLSVGSSYLPQAQYHNFSDAPLYVPKPTGGDNVLAYFDESSRMIRAPRYTQTAAIDYTFDLGPGALDLGADYYYSSSFLWNTDGRFKQSAYSLVNAQASYKIANSGVRVGLWARNIFDKKYMSGLSETAGGDVYSPAAPRTFGVKLGYSF